MKITITVCPTCESINNKDEHKKIKEDAKSCELHCWLREFKSVALIPDFIYAKNKKTITVCSECNSCLESHLINIPEVEMLKILTTPESIKIIESLVELE